MSEITVPGAVLQESPDPRVISCARCLVSQAALVVRAEHLCEYVCLRPASTCPLTCLEENASPSTLQPRS